MIVIVNNFVFLSVENVGDFRLINNNGITLKGLAARNFLFDHNQNVRSYI